jgi:peptidoglycan/LPS O-acetylase OafA/YrhL
LTCLIKTGPPLGPRTFYPRLEALRGVAALSVAAFHSWQSPWLDSVGRIRNFLPFHGEGFIEGFCVLALRIIGNGYGAVVLFFVLSGFVLSATLVHGPTYRASSAMQFGIARLFRIYPAVFLAIAMFAAVFWTTGVAISAEPFSLGLLLRNVLLFDISIDGVMWSLQLEVIAIPLIFVAYQGWWRWGGAFLAGLFLPLAALSFWGPWNRAIGAPNLFGEIHAFVLGMAAYLVAPRFIEHWSARTGTLVFAVAAFLFLVSRPLLGFASTWSALTEAASGAVGVAILAVGRPNGPAVIFDASIVRFFGRISYSFYLLHPLTLLVMWKIPTALGAVVQAGVPTLSVAALLFVASVAAVTPLAYASYRWVERPGVAAGRSMRRALIGRTASSIAMSA